MKKFPKTIYVTRETAVNESPFLTVADDGEMPEVDSNTPVAIYELVEVAEIVVTRVLKTKSKK